MAYCYRCSVVCVSLLVSVPAVSCVEMTKPIEAPFICPRNHALGGTWIARGTGNLGDISWSTVNVVGSTPPGVPLSGNNLGQVVHTHVPLSPSSTIWQRSKGWEANRRSGVTLAMHHRLQWFIHLWAHGLDREMRTLHTLSEWSMAHLPYLYL